MSRFAYPLLETSRCPSRCSAQQDQVPEFRRAPELLPELTAEHRRVRGYNVDGEGGEAGGSGGAGADGAAAGVAGVRIKSEVP